MAWTARRERNLVILEKTITMPSDSSTVTSESINGLDPTEPFTVIGNLNEVSLNNDADVDVQGAVDEANGPWPNVQTDLITSLTGSVVAARHDPSADNWAPYYRLAVVPDATMSQSDVDFAVVQKDFH